MEIRIQHIITFLNRWAPPATKMEYDNVGLLIGNPNDAVTNVLTCLDVTEEVVSEAIEKNCELIVAHHPLIFNKIGSINPVNEQGRIIYRLIKNNIALIVAHTNLDAALDGVSFVLANMLGLDNLKFLSKEFSISKKIRLFTDYANAEAVLKLLNYYSAEDAHYYSVEGREDNYKCFEAVIDRYNLPELKVGLQKEGLLKNTDLQILNLASPSKNAGFGVLGEYPEGGIDQDEFLYLIGKSLNVKAVRYSGSVDKVKRVAVCGGAGIFLKDKAIAAGADAFVTADIKYHDYFTEKKKFLLVDVGHYESEFPIAEAIKNELTAAFENLKVNVTQAVTNPMKIFIPKT